MKRPQLVRVGDVFTHNWMGQRSILRREPDDPNPTIRYEPFRVTALSNSDEPEMHPYTFNAEQAWFRERGLYAVDARCEGTDYHDRIRSDGALFDAEAIPIGRQDAGMVMDLGLCPGCGTTVSKLISDEGDSRGR